MRQNNDVVLVMKHVSFRYSPGTPFERVALDEVDLVVTRGERIAIVGQTGSGKSTLAGLCNGILKPSRGTVTVFGMDTRGDAKVQKQLRAKVGHVMQNPEDQLFEQYVGDDIAFGPLKLGLTIDEARERARASMAAVGLDFAEKDTPIYTLSRGRKRLVAIAGILAMEPELLILDEPTSGLDPLSATSLLESLSRLCEEKGTTLIIITHQLGEVVQLASRVVVMDHGKIIRDGEPELIFLTDEELPRGLDVPDEVKIAKYLHAAGVGIDRKDWNAKGFAEAMVKSLMQREVDNGKLTELE